jgi:peptide-methionine (S)-S-oxide reductase
VSDTWPAVARSVCMKLGWIAVLALTSLAPLGCHATRTTADVTPEPSASGVATPVHVGADPGHAGNGTPLTATGHDKLAAFAAGCFWGVEDAFRHVPGVVATAVGYAGGHTTDPDYPKVCTHTTGHAETVLVEFDPARVPYEHLLRVFWKIHDPTQVGGQGPDEGDSYRSVVFTFDDDEAAAARASLQAEQKHLDQRITTEVRPMNAFYKAEGYHQQYAERTGHHGCPIRVPVDNL